MEVICLAEMIEREGRVYPAVYSANGDYKAIALDPNGSICYWRKNGDVSISEEENSGSVGVQYKTVVPLKFVGFLKKEIGKDDQYFSENIINGIIGNLTVNNSALKTALKAKTVRVSAVKYVTDGRQVGKGEYENIDFEPIYTNAYFSIDFELAIVASTQCYFDICDYVPFDPLTRYNFCSDEIFNRLSPSQIACLTNRLCGMYNELTLLSGLIDGINPVFVWSDAPIQLFRNGQLLSDGLEYTTSGNTTVLNSPPFVDDVLAAYGNI